MGLPTIVQIGIEPGQPEVPPIYHGVFSTMQEREEQLKNRENYLFKNLEKQVNTSKLLVARISSKIIFIFIFLNFNFYGQLLILRRGI